MTPETNVEATAAMQPMSDTNANTSTQQGRGIAGVQGTRFAMQGQPTQMAQEQNYVDGTEESSYVVFWTADTSVTIEENQEIRHGYSSAGSNGVSGVFRNALWFCISDLLYNFDLRHFDKLAIQNDNNGKN
ncbi:hypothetical protein F4604DRAFT_1684165 [Suillus subluteus]|nr:hypothetical protein F4604DRAFT_1684165 [Suillus subluteus]